MMKSSMKAILLAGVSAFVVASTAMAQDGSITQVTLDPGNPVGPAGVYDNDALGVHAGVTLSSTTWGVINGKVDSSRLDTFTPSAAAPAGSAEKWAADAIETIDNHTSQIGTLQTTKADKSYVDAKNEAQDTVIAEHTATLADHEDRITTNTAGIAATNTRLNSFNGTGETVETWATGVDNTLADHGARIGTAETNISALYGLYGAQQGQINTLNSRMDKAYAGIAMATAFESPQVDPGKRFGLSLNWGEFEGVSAFSSSAKLRFNDNWAATGGAAVSQGGQVAAKVGIQTQW